MKLVCKRANGMAWAVWPGLAAAMVLLGGCEINASSSAERQTLSISGLYKDPNGGRIVNRNSGAAIRWLMVQQLGDRIEAQDNNGRLFRGTLHAESDRYGILNLQGSTTTGVQVTISGSVTIQGTKGLLRGSWVEPALLGTIVAEADLPTPTPAPTNTVAVATSP